MTTCTLHDAHFTDPQISRPLRRREWASDVRSRYVRTTPPKEYSEAPRRGFAQSGLPAQGAGSGNPWANTRSRGAGAAASSAAFSASLAHRLADEDVQGQDVDFEFEVELEDEDRPSNVGPKLLWAAKGRSNNRRPQSAALRKSHASSAPPPAAAASSAASGMHMETVRPRFSAAAMSSLPSNQTTSLATDTDFGEPMQPRKPSTSSQEWTVEGKPRAKDKVFTKPKPFKSMESGGHAASTGIIAEK